jgi:hypothetical protein
MPANGLNIGKDQVLDITTSRGTLRLAIRTKFMSKQITKSIESEAADGVNRFAELPAGWEGSFDLDRASSGIDDYFAGAETDYYGGGPGDVITITETISEVDGSVSQYVYTKVALKYDDAGEKGGNKLIQQKVGFKATRRLKVA